MVLLESFREGTPVVARRLGPFPEVIDTSGAGLLFDTGEQLDARLRELAGDPALRSRLGESGRRAFETHWSEEVMVPRYLALIERIAEEKGRSLGA